MWKNDWRGLKWIWESAAVSISCQITTGPLAYLYFGTFPQYFLLTNLIALPLVGLVIPLGLLTIILQACDISASFLCEITEFMLSTMVESLSTIASL
jgi:competence protein ComEC